MIKNSEPLSMAEVEEYAKKDKDSGVEIIGFMKKFKGLNPTEARELREKITGLNLMKVDMNHLVKIIDLLPANAEDLNKIFVDMSLNEDETKKILDTVKEFK